MIIPPNVNAHSYLLGRGDAERDARIRTIGAIRLAVAEARKMDAAAKHGRSVIASRTRVDLLFQSAAIRRAIRAAIGSTKS